MPVRACNDDVDSLLLSGCWLRKLGGMFIVARVVVAFLKSLALKWIGQCRVPVYKSSFELH